MVRKVSVHGKLGDHTAKACPVPVDINEDTSREVREDTAELASWALSDKNSFSSGHSPVRNSLFPSVSSKDSKNDAKISKQASFDQRLSRDFPRPDAIPEASEPASPSSAPSFRKSQRTSALSQMFRDSPLVEDAGSGTDDGDPSLDSSGLEPATVEGGIISQPNEQTALLLKKQVHNNSNGNMYGNNHDLESQKTSHDNQRYWKHNKILKTITNCSIRTTARIRHPKSWDSKSIWQKGLLRPASFVPPVILGLLLNILDALSYGVPTPPKP